MVFVTISFTGMVDVVSSEVGEEKETRVQVRKEEIQVKILHKWYCHLLYKQTNHMHLS